ncbi:putative ion transporter [Diaporthe ampelina]|uniref:Putative ion transporter n=1 Tax=Diaporthe ampelina TaxID=1214573 RepID=A0A0G2IEC2_9PEZI|nr:putative ion transporter [Diaporthe ampelina]
MPIRVKSRKQPGADEPPRSPSPMGQRFDGYGLPDIREDDSFRELIKKLSVYFNAVVVLPVTFEQLRTTSAGQGLRELVEHLGRECSHPAIVNALLLVDPQWLHTWVYVSFMALKWHYGAATEDKGVNEARANAAEIVAWRFLTHLSEREVMNCCLYEIPDPDDAAEDAGARDEENGRQSQEVDENTALLAQSLAGTVNSAKLTLTNTGSKKRYQLLKSISRLTMPQEDDDEDDEEDPTKPFVTLNALEIAAVADAKRFLSQHVVQKIITGIWNGDIIFWDRLAVDSEKRPRFYNKATADPFSRLRVPKYLKSFEVIFFVIFLFLYYSVLVERNPEKISTNEVLLYVWFLAFAYDELSEYVDAGSIFYATDIWNLFDITMICIGFIFSVLRIVGLSKHDEELIGLSFDVLALLALFMVPRVCSVLSLSPYWGTLIPCLKEMGKDFVKFMVLVFIVYLGFLTTFTLVARDTFTLPAMTMNLAKIFYGSSYIGFDIMNQIDPFFGPPLMFIFVTLSSILLMGSLTGMLSNSFSRVMSHAREEYLYVYSVYVLEASTSNRLTHFYPPFNLLALVIFRPLRLVLPSDNKFRAARIILLKATHLPIVGAIMMYELVKGKVASDEFYGFKGPRLEGTLGSGGSAAQRKASRAKIRPASSSSAYARQQQQQRRPQSGVSETLRPVSAPVRSTPMADPDIANDDMDAPTDMDVKIAELSSKIDRLTDMILSMQRERSRDASQHTEPAT